MSPDESRVASRFVPHVGQELLKSPGLLTALVVLLGGVAASEGFLFVGERQAAVWGHFLTLLAAGALLWRTAEDPTVRALALVPLFRLVNLGMPVFVQLTAYWFPLIYGPLVPALVYVRRLQPDLEVPWGLRESYVLLPWAVFFGYGLAELEYAIVQPEALIPTWSLGQVAMIAVVMICFVGFVEEYLFRGILQATLEDRLGRPAGLLIASAVFGLMHAGYGVAGEVVFAGAIGLFFGLLYDYTRSLAFVTLTHGVLNVFLFAVLPLQGSLVPVLEGYLAAP